LKYKLVYTNRAARDIQKLPPEIKKRLNQIGHYQYLEKPLEFHELAEKIFTNDGKARKKFWKMFRESQKGKISLWQILRDLFQIKRSI